VEGDSRQATLHCSALGLPALPMGLAHPLHLPHHLHLAADSDIVHDLADPLHLAADSNSATSDESGDDVGSESSEETDLHGSLNLVVDHPCLHAIR
jgi:hypothetical protein